MAEVLPVIVAMTAGTAGMQGSHGSDVESRRHLNCRGRNAQLT